MIVTNTETIAGYNVVEIKGLVQGNTVRAKHAGRDIAAGLKNLVGGELRGYTELLTESRRQAMERMLGQAEQLGANQPFNQRPAKLASQPGRQARTDPQPKRAKERSPENTIKVPGRYPHQMPWNRGQKHLQHLHQDDRHRPPRPQVHNQTPQAFLIAKQLSKAFLLQPGRHPQQEDNKEYRYASAYPSTSHRFSSR